VTTTSADDELDCSGAYALDDNVERPRVVKMPASEEQD